MQEKRQSLVKKHVRVFTYGHLSTNIQPHLGRHPVQITAIFSGDTEIMSLAEPSIAQVQTENGTGSYRFRGGWSDLPEYVTFGKGGFIFIAQKL